MTNTEVTQAERDALTNEMQAAGTAQPVDLNDRYAATELEGLRGRMALAQASMTAFARDLISDLEEGDTEAALRSLNEFLQNAPAESRRNVVFISGYDQDGKRVAVKSVATQFPSTCVDAAVRLIGPRN